MGNGNITGVGERARVQTPPVGSGAQPPPPTSQAIRDGARAVEALPEHGASPIAAPRIGIVRGPSGEEQFELTIPGRGALSSEDAEAIRAYVTSLANDLKKDPEALKAMFAPRVPRPAQPNGSDPAAPNQPIGGLHQ